MVPIKGRGRKRCFGLESLTGLWLGLDAGIPCYSVDFYRVTIVVGYMGFVDFDLGCSTNLPSRQIPRQFRQFCLGRTRKTVKMTKITVNPAHVPDHYCHPVDKAF